MTSRLSSRQCELCVSLREVPSNMISMQPKRKRAIELCDRRFLFPIVGALAVGLLIAGAYFGLLYTGIASKEPVSSPPSTFSGTWRPTGVEDGCNSNRIAFEREQFEFRFKGYQLVLHAKYESADPSLLTVEYSAGSVQVRHVFKAFPETGTIQLVAINTTDAIVQAAASRLVGTHFIRCSPS